MSKKWVMRVVDDVSIPHWIIEEEVNELPNTYKRVGFCDAQEDAELIITAPKLEATATRLRGLLREVDEHVQVCPICLIRIKDHPFEWNKKGEDHADDCRLAKELRDSRLAKELKDG